MGQTRLHKNKLESALEVEEERYRRRPSAADTSAVDTPAAAAAAWDHGWLPSMLLWRKTPNE